MRMLALLVALLLPLHGVAGAISSIHTPAHYHLHAPQEPLQPPAYVPQHDDDVLVQLDVRVARGDGGQHSRVGNHAHAFGDADVVYLDGDSDPSDPGTAGKQASVGGEAPLPAWSMPPLLVTRAPDLSEPASYYRSHRVGPLLRPPSMTRRSPA